jgi:creatinine amidohydrolase
LTDLAKCTWEEARELFGTGTVAILPIGCTEPHGPHLPLDVDVTIALAQSRRAAELLGTQGVRAVVLPPLPYGLTNFSDGFAGRITLRPGTLWALLEDVVESIEQQDVRQIVFSNGHLEPKHVEVLRGVALDHPRRGPQTAQVLFPDNTRRRFAETLGEAFQRGDHAGRYETSIVQAAAPADVREDLRRSLPPVDVDLVGGLGRGARTFLELGAAQAYCGDPAAASPGEGRELVEKLAALIAGAVRETWPDLFA